MSSVYGSGVRWSVLSKKFLAQKTNISLSFRPSNFISLSQDAKRDQQREGLTRIRTGVTGRFDLRQYHDSDIIKIRCDNRYTIKPVLIG